MVTRDARSGVPSRLRSRLSASSRHRRRGRSGSERLPLGPKGRAHDRPQARSETEQHNSRKSTWTAPHRNAAERVPIGRKRPPVDGHERAWALDDDCRIGARRRRGEVEAVCGLCVSLSPRLGHALPGRPSKRARCVSFSSRTRIFTRIALRLHRTLTLASCAPRSPLSPLPSPPVPRLRRWTPRRSRSTASRPFCPPASRALRQWPRSSAPVARLWCVVVLA